MKIRNLIFCYWCQCCLKNQIFGASEVKWSKQWSLLIDILFSSDPASNSLVSVSDSWRAFWAGMANFNFPRHVGCIASGTSGKQEPHHVWCPVGAEVRGTASWITDANLDCAFVENTLLLVVPKIGRTQTTLGPKYNIHEFYLHQFLQFWIMSFLPVIFSPSLTPSLMAWRTITAATTFLGWRNEGTTGSQKEATKWRCRTGEYR